MISVSRSIILSVVDLHSLFNFCVSIKVGRKKRSVEGKNIKFYKFHPENTDGQTDRWTDNTWANPSWSVGASNARSKAWKACSCSRTAIEYISLKQRGQPMKTDRDVKMKKDLIIPYTNIRPFKRNKYTYHKYYLSVLNENTHSTMTKTKSHAFSIRTIARSHTLA